ncbi:DALR anticodon-binding domain-containing protein 3 [Vanessa tameamea]|uniref:DALR anticodon-binding domain-containing protein 3 n=1 Tax=Vanessa tameamea TaxID=334116 RepID=A0A8B8HHA4_VANTA
MLQDDTQTIISNLYKYLLGEEKYVHGLLVKKHSGNLQQLGDFSFPNNVKSWQEFLDSVQLQNSLNQVSLLKYINKDLTNLIETSQNWDIPVVKATELNERIHLLIDRFKAIQVCFHNASINNEFILQRIHGNTNLVKLDPSCKKTNCITYLRIKILTDVIRNLYLLNVCPESTDIIVTLKSKSDVNNYNKSIFCGTVLNAKTGTKENTITAEEYIRIRQDELTLIAQHKYGVRVSTEAKWKEFIASLGESAVAFELLQTKCTSPVKIQFDASGGSSKGAAFILYNCARLETIIKTFNEKVNEGTYPQLPPIENANLSLLADEDEWNLVFNYVMGVPSLLKSSVEINEKKCEFRPHLICNFLSSMVKILSQYYRRVRILTEPRKHLLPVMFARIHLIITLNNTLKICLRILNIKSVSQMYRTLILFPQSFVNFNKFMT